MRMGTEVDNRAGTGDEAEGGVEAETGAGN